jgi:pimeloyl-ACP methyl ester carboxylesterase
MTCPSSHDLGFGRFLALVCAGLVLVVASSCTINNVPTKHIVMADANGRPLDPTGNINCKHDPQLCQGKHFPVWLLDYRELATATRPGATGMQYDDYLEELFREMRDEFKRRRDGTAPCKAKSEKRIGGSASSTVNRVLIFIHGGLNEQMHAIERAATLTQRIMEDCEYYPVFINWDSSLFSSYYDHVFHLRQGEYIDFWHAKSLPLAPVYLVADLVRGVIQAPMVWAAELGKLEIEEGLQDTFSPAISIPLGSTIEDDYKRVSCDLMRDARVNPKSYCTRYPPLSDPPAGPVIAIGEGNDDRKFSETFWSGFGWTLTLGTKIIGGPLIEAFGENAWNTMLRRTNLLFRTEEEFEGQATGRYRDASGAVTIFLRRLAKEIDASGGKENWDIALVGHSMGTIVANKMLRDFPDLPFNNVLYMGAASTVQDYEDSTFPYLQKNREAHLYHLTLLEAAEERERFDTPIPFTNIRIPYVDLPPRGSLLVWIDDYLASPKTYRDRTVGSYANLMLSVHDTPDKIRDRIHIKAFGAGADVEAPQMHGDLVSKFYFWRHSCWLATDQIQPECFKAKGHMK